MSDAQLNLEFKTEMSVAKAQNLMGGTPHILPEQVDKRGGHSTSKFGHMFILGWGHRT